MTKPKGIFKKRKNKGNRFYRLNPLVLQIEPSNVESNVSQPSTSRPSLRPNPPVVKPVSASKRKLSQEYVSSNNGSVNVVFDFGLLSTIISQNLACKSCGGNVSLAESATKRSGLASCFIISCDDCGEVCTFWNSHKTTSGLFEINTRLIYGMRCIGKGQTATKVLCGMLNVHPPLTKTNKYKQLLRSSLHNVAESSMKKAVFEAVEQVEKEKQMYPLLDIPIAFDATWQKRGHVSKNAVATITNFDTGKVIDVEVLSKYCHTCAIQKGKPNPTEHRCSQNYEGFSGGMETAAAVAMFQRSQRTRGVRYTQFLGDGDSSAFKTVHDSKPYNGVEITKLECVGHVQKRMGTRLRNLKKNCGVLSDGKTMKGAGRLTDSLIDKLQDYYGNAIRNNRENLEAMTKAVWAAWFHRKSTDENPQHNLCSADWCAYKKAQKNGEEEMYKHKPTPEAIMEAIRPIYKDLANKDLLRKCLHGRTQNANESFNNVVWSRIPKNNFVGKELLEMGVWDAVITYNDGCVSRLQVLRDCGVQDVGKNTEEAMLGLDRLRVKKAEIAIQLITKEARIERRRKKLVKESLDKEKDYKSGGF